MKTIAAITLAAAIAQADSILPEAPDRSRYAETLAKSPFVLETKAEEKAVEEKPFVEGLYLRAITKANGKDCVLVQRLGQDKPMSFIGSDPGEDGLFVKSVKVGNSFRETRVVMQKGAEFGEIGFKEEAITAVPAAPQPRQGPGGGPGGPPGFIRPGMSATPGAATGQTRIVAPPIPRPQTTNTVVPLPSTTTNAAPRPGSSPGQNVLSLDANRRQRVRVINN